jgi:CheY-like chemotaxis protein
LLADIDVILTNSRHLSGLVDDVLDLSQVDAGHMALSRTWASITDIVDAAIVAVKPLFASKGLYLNARLGNDARLYCDPIRVRQIVVNLLSNAGRFTQSGGATVRVGTRDGDTLVVSVSDTGPGIPVEAQNRLFEPFSQVGGGRPQGSSGGSGLGLAICRRFVEMHGGKLWVESAPGKGSTFAFAIPMRPSVVGDTLATPRRWFSPYHEYEPRARPEGTLDRELGPRIVVLDRGETLPRIVQRYREGAEIVVTRSLDQMVAEVSRTPAQIVLVNQHGLVQVDRLDGILDRLPYGTPAVVFSLADIERMAQELGVREYLVKPVSGRRLAKAIDDLGEHVSRILIADDEPDALQLFSRILGALGRDYEVYRASSGQRALDLLVERKPDLLLLDLVMPDVDGYEVLRRKRADASIRDIPAIAISAQDPYAEPVTAPALTVYRHSGLRPSELLTVVDALSTILSPPDRLGRVRVGTLDAQRVF